MVFGNGMVFCGIGDWARRNLVWYVVWYYHGITTKYHGIIIPFTMVNGMVSSVGRVGDLVLTPARIQSRRLEWGTRAFALWILQDTSRIRRDTSGYVMYRIQHQIV